MTAVPKQPYRSMHNPTYCNGSNSVLGYYSRLLTVLRLRFLSIITLIKHLIKLALASGVGFAASVPCVMQHSNHGLPFC